MKIGKYKKTGVWGLGLLLILLVVPFFIPLESYLQQAESKASESLGVPVKLTKASLFFLPTPHVSIRGVEIGESKDALAAKAVITPTLSTFFSSQRVIDVDLHQVILKQSALGLLGALSDTGESQEPAVVALRALTIKHLHLDIADNKIPDSNVFVEMENNQLMRANIDATDGTIHMVLAPEEGGYHAALELKDFQLPGESKLVIDNGIVDMKQKDSQLNVTSFDLTMYKGRASGQGMLTWGKNWQLKGDCVVKELALAKPTRLFSPDTYMSGRLNGQGGFSAQANEAANLLDRIRAQFTFNVDNGVLHGLDLIKAASLLVKQHDTSGETQFDRFSGKLNVSGKQYKLSKLEIHSGLLTAKGHVKVTPKEKLDGLIDMQIKKSAGLVSVPLAVAGTVEHPTIGPSKAALVGAAAGTAVLGPGIGTSIGIEASKRLDKLKNLFNGESEK